MRFLDQQHMSQPARSGRAMDPEMFDDPDQDSPDEECLVLVAGNGLQLQDRVVPEQLADIDGVTAFEEASWCA